MNSVGLAKRHLMIALLGTGIIISSILVTPDTYARHLSDSQRYNDGFNDGSQAAMTDRPRPVIQQGRTQAMGNIL
jgi:hypothetical protein